MKIKGEGPVADQRIDCSTLLFFLVGMEGKREIAKRLSFLFFSLGVGTASAK